MSIQAFHTAWSTPLFARDPQATYGVEDFELFTTILSALSWKQHNGSIVLFCDEVAHAYYDRIGLLPLWEQTLPLPLDAGLDAACYWAAGKLLALRQMDAPCVMLDTDFIVWQPIAHLLEGLPLATIHREPLVPHVYPDPRSLRTRTPYDFSSYDLKEPAANTALAWFADADFKDRYVDTALDFMRNTLPNGDRLIYMVFAEQRLLPMLAAREGVPLTALSDLEQLFHSGQNFFTHTWGYKNILRTDPLEREKFCRRCAARITRDFPDFAPRVAAINGMTSYFDTPEAP